jgi:phosphonate transport system substrate-binding protein
MKVGCTLNRPLLWILLLAVLLGCLGACSAKETETPQPTALVMEEMSIVLGDISDDPSEVIEGTQPLADYLADQLSEFGITSGQVKVAQTTDQVARWLADGEVDLYFDSVYPATLVSDISGAQPILRRWRYGVESYHAVIFASKDSGITNISELTGHLVAMDNQYSTSGYLLPAVYLVEHGLSLVSMGSYTESVAADKVGVVFSFDDENTFQWVLRGFTSAGVTDDYHFDTAFPPGATGQLVVLARTEAVPRQVVVARPGLDSALLDAIIDILLSADQDPNGAAALEPFQTSRFDEFPEGIDAATARMHEMMKVIEGLPIP